MATSDFQRRSFGRPASSARRTSEAKAFFGGPTLKNLRPVVLGHGVLGLGALFAALLRSHETNEKPWSSEGRRGCGMKISSGDARLFLHRSRFDARHRSLSGGSLGLYASATGRTTTRPVAVPVKEGWFDSPTRKLRMHQSRHKCGAVGVISVTWGRQRRCGVGPGGRRTCLKAIAQRSQSWGSI